MLVSSIVGFSFGHPTSVQPVQKVQSRSAQNNNRLSTNTHLLNSCCPKGRKINSNIQNSNQKLSIDGVKLSFTGALNPDLLKFSITLYVS